MKTTRHIFFRSRVHSFFTATVVLWFSTQIFSMEKQEQKSFRHYEDSPFHVKEFYKCQHAKQTVEFVQKQQIELQTLTHQIKTADLIPTLLSQQKLKQMTIWEAIMMLDQLKDQSDPDFSLPNSVHALQTAEAIRKDLPKIARDNNTNEENLSWLILVGLLHDIGKVDALLRKVPQWAVVGDTFPVGCRFSLKNIFPHFFKDNPDSKDARYNTRFGIYLENIGLKNMLLSFGHDEYAYQVLKHQGNLPSSALFIIRFHSFYPFHHQNAYKRFLSESDKENLPWSKFFSSYDLYSKSDRELNIEELRPFYRNLINRYFPPTREEINSAPEKALAEHKLLWPVLNDIH